MDILSKVLEATRLESSVLSHFLLGEPWGLRFPQHLSIPFYAVLQGHCWLWIDGSAPTEIAAGDLVVLPHGSPHAVASTPTCAVASIFDALARQHVPIWALGDESQLTQLQYGGPGDKTSIVAGAFGFRSRPNHITQGLPALLRVDNNDSHIMPLIEAAIRYIMDEVKIRQPGCSAVATRLADLLFIEVLRSYWSKPQQDLPGLLLGLADPRIRCALEAMHHAPQTLWTVAQLARCAGMSRSSFAAHFHERIGASPMEYLTHWRMQLASERLAEGKVPLAAVAEALGYRSQFAFANTFKRTFGVSPGRFRRLHPLRRS
jgi:AraC-like DNA-binding protein